MAPKSLTAFFIVLPFIAFFLSSCQNDSVKVKLNESELIQLEKNIGDRFELDNILDSTGKSTTLDFSNSAITIIDFWNNSCPPCIMEMKQFEDLLKGKESKISIYSISVNQYWLWKPTLAEHKGNFSFLNSSAPNWKQYNLKTTQDAKLRNEFSKDRIDEIEKKYNVTFYPSYFVVDRNGIIISRPESAVEFIKEYN